MDTPYHAQLQAMRRRILDGILDVQQQEVKERTRHAERMEVLQATREQMENNLREVDRDLAQLAARATGGRDGGEGE